MTDSYRVFVELPNGAKFRAQGDVQNVRVDLDQFYTRMTDVKAPTVNTTANHQNGQNGNGHTAIELSGDGEVQDAADASRITESLDHATLERLFTKDKNNTVSLRALPHGDNAEADALIALIYGASKLANEQQVTGSRLMKAVAQSGLHQVDRVDRFLNSQIGQFVTAAGYKKGRRYGLTNPGIRRAEDILRAILN
jgi:hypothetical protein